jgi:single-strand DNA-binding protein
MNSLNSLLIEGNVVRDAVVKETPRGSLVCSFSIASNRYFKQGDEYEQETSFFDVETWSKLAESCAKNCLKGRGVRIVGRLKQERWTGTDGKNYAKVKLVADHVEFKPQFKGRPGEEKNSVDVDEVADIAVSAAKSDVATEEEISVPAF